MFYGDVYLVYDLLDAATARKQFMSSAQVVNFGSSNTQVMRCLGLLWKQGLIHAPCATLRPNGVSVSLGGGITDAGRAVHELLRETLWGVEGSEANDANESHRPRLHVVC